MEIISKELLGEVLNFNFQDLRDYKIDRFCFPNENTIAVGYANEDGWKHINIHELAYKCKEWAKKEGYLLYSYPMYVENNRYGCDIKDKRRVQLAMIPSNTEPESVFKACQWIYDNKDK